MIDNPNDPSLRSFIDVPPDSPFPIQNLPFGVFQRPGVRPDPRFPAQRLLARWRCACRRLQPVTRWSIITHHFIERPFIMCYVTFNLLK